MRNTCPVWEGIFFLFKEQEKCLLSLTNLLENRKGLLLSTIKDAEERYQKALEDFNNARIFLEEAQIKAKEIRENGVLQLSKEKEKLILASEQGYQKLEDYRNSTIALREQNLINDIRQQVSYLALQVTLKTFNDRLNTDLHSRIVDYYIGLFKNMEE